jgi:hypothetical protein
MSTTLLELTKRVGGMLGDMTALTADVVGNTTVFNDTQALTINMEAPRNRDILFSYQVSGTGNLGVVRRVTNFDMNAGWVSFDAIPEATAVGDKAELYNFRGKGWRVTEYWSAINQAIQEAFPLYKQPYNAAVASTFDITTGNITIPTTITHVAEIEYENTAGTWYRVPRSRRRGQSGWWVDDYAGTINVRDNNYTALMNGRSVRLIGATKPTPLTLGTDITYIDPEWLCARAASILCMSALDRDQGNYARGNYFQGQANANLSAIRTRGNWIPVTYTAL